MNSKSTTITYRNYIISLNIHGYYTTFLKYKGTYIQSDTLASIKQSIDTDIQTSHFFTAHTK